MYINQLITQYYIVLSYDISSCLCTMPAWVQITDSNMPVVRKDQESSSALLREAQLYKPIIGTFLPVLTKVSQWTQVLSMNNQVTILLLPLAVKQIRFKVQTDKTLIEHLAETMHRQLNRYFSDESLNYYSYLVSAFLDPRVYLNLTEDEKDDAIVIIKSNLVSEVNNKYLQSNKRHKKNISEDKLRLARLLGKAMPYEEDEINETPTLSSSGTSTSKRIKTLRSDNN